MSKRAVVSHREAAPVVPCRGTILRPGLVSPDGYLPWAEHYRRAARAVLAQGRGQQAPWGGDGSKGILSGVSNAPQLEMGADERGVGRECDQSVSGFGNVRGDGCAGGQVGFSDKMIMN